jgi:hypothetical protein
MEERIMKFTKLTLVAMLLTLLVCAFVACGVPVETQGETEGNTPVVTDPVETEPTVTEPVETECQHVVVEQIDEPTCESRGYKREICSVCNEQLSVKPIDAIDHVEAAPATCTEGSVCKFCGVQMAAAAGHKIGDITDKKDATASEAGYEKGACTVCGEEITNVIPAGILIDFNDQAEGGLTKDAFAALEGFEMLIPGGESGEFTIVAEGDNKYVKKTADNKAPAITFKDHTGILGQGKFAFSMDVRFDGDTSNSGLFSVKDNDDKEHRVLSTWVGGKVRLGKNGGPDFLKPGNEWFNLRVVVNPATYEYEVWINGEKVLYTVADENVSTKYVLWTLTDGEWSSANLSDKHVNESVVPSDPSVGISRIYLFHFSATPMSIDNMRLEFFPAE